MSSGSSTHSSVWPRTNSPGWRMNGLIAGDAHDLGQVRLLLARVDDRVAMVVEDAELAVEVQVHRRGLQAGRDRRGRRGCGPPGARPDVAVGEDAHPTSVRGAARAADAARRRSRRLPEPTGSIAPPSSTRWSGRLPRRPLGPLGVEGIDLVLELLEVVERLVDAHEADEGDVVEVAQVVHGHLADERRGATSLSPWARRVGLDGVGRIVRGVVADRAPRQRLGEAGRQLVAVELLARAVALEDRRGAPTRRARRS